MCTGHKSVVARLLQRTNGWYILRKINAMGINHSWTKPFSLPRPGLHRMAWRDFGPPHAPVWLVVHGGPGGACQPGMLAPFDLQRDRVIAPDQRGAGSSRPRGLLARNNTAALVEDLEALRAHLGIERWSILAGSWGSVVALAYAARYPHRVQRLVLRGSFRLTRREIAGLLQPSVQKGKRLGGADDGWPLGHSLPLSVALGRAAQLLQKRASGATAMALMRGWQLRELRDAATGVRRSLGRQPAALAVQQRRDWMSLRRQMRHLEANLPQPRRQPQDEQRWSRYRIQAHYLVHRGFIGPQGLDAAVRTMLVHRIPIDWVHGRLDAICPPANSRRWMAAAHGAPWVWLHQPVAGHLSGEQAMQMCLRECVAQDRSISR